MNDNHPPTDRNDYDVHMYQDDFNTGFDDTDPLIPELTDDPTEELGVKPKEFKNELDKYDFDENGNGDDDMREHIEDADEDMDVPLNSK